MQPLALSQAKCRIWETSDHISNIDERPGLLVLFPAAIPGCGKSTLLNNNSVAKLEVTVSAMQESTNGENRRIEVLSGDKLQHQKLKYWKHVQEQRLINNSTITLADKNVPLGTWDQVARICAQTNGRAVAVVPKSSGVFQTTFVDGVVRTLDDPNKILPQKHHYPFSLVYLAVCLARVLSRRNDSHVGALDPTLQHTCMIVYKFFALYRSVSSVVESMDLRRPIG